MAMSLKLQNNVVEIKFTEMQNNSFKYLFSEFGEIYNLYFDIQLN